VTAGGRGLLWAQKADAAGRIQPLFLAQAAEWRLGYWLVDAPESDWGSGALVEAAPEGGALAAGDVVVALFDQPIVGVGDLLDVLRSCRCGGDACRITALGDGACLDAGDAVEVTALKGGRLVPARMSLREL